MIKSLIFLSLINILTEAVVIASWGNPSPSSDFPNSEFGLGDSSSSSSSDSISLGEFFDRLRGGGSSSSSGNYYNNNNNYNYAYQQPASNQIYGSAGYSTGYMRNYYNIRGQQNSNYNEYSANYWKCVNYYRGQYYYSYTFNGYVCDTRANRNG